jgi:uncharacterized membrane protein
VDRHRRFLAAFGVGVVAALLAHLVGLDAWLKVLLSADLFYVAYLFLMLPLTRLTPASLRQRASGEDEGVLLIIAMAFVAVAMGLAAVIGILSQDSARTLSQTILALAAVPLGWAMIHTLAAFHYAHMFYGRGEGDADSGGFAFPGGGDPGMWDFLYVGFGIGMTAQLSDVSVTSSAVRKAVLLHCITSFFLNTVILALAVNAAVTLSS